MTDLYHDFKHGTYEFVADGSWFLGVYSTNPTAFDRASRTVYTHLRVGVDHFMVGVSASGGLVSKIPQPQRPQVIGFIR